MDATRALTHVAYYHDMGLGKTFTGSEKMIQLDTKINLIICQKSKINDWVQHFEKYYKYHVCDLTKTKSLNEFFGKCLSGKYHVVGIINYDLVWRRSEIKQLKNFTLMLDESSLIQNETAKRSKFILRLQPKNVILLSGTPTGGKYEKLWSQLHLLGWPISKKLYWNQYINTETIDSEGFPITIVTGYKNVDRLKRKMRQFGCNFLKTEDVLTLPEQIDQKVSVDTISAYRKFEKTAIVEINDDTVIGGKRTLVGDTALTKMLKERQLCGQYNDYKLIVFQDLLESTDDRLIVFYNFTEELARMRAIVNKMNREWSLVNGERKDLTCYENFDDSITFVQYQAGAMGLNLQKANKIVYFTPPLSSEFFEQSKKRIHRLGQKNSCFYYYLTCRNSIEEKIYETLAQRKDYTEALFKEEES